MATAPDQKAAIDLENTWEDQDPKARLRTIAKLDSSASEAQATLKHIARNDDYVDVRCSAIMLLSDLNLLKEFQQEKSPVKDSATQQIYRIIGGSFNSELDEAQRLSQLSDLSTAALKQIALISKCKAVGGKTVEMIEQAEDLSDLCLFASSVHVRKSAALKIQDTELLAEIREKVQGKDKTVFKVIEQRLAKIEESSAPKTDTGKETKAEESKAKSAPGDPVKASDKEITGTKKPATKSDPKKAPKPPLDAENLLPPLELEIPKLSFKNTSRLYEVRSTLNKLLSNAENLNADFPDRIEKLKNSVAEKLEKNNEYQEKTRQSTETLLESLKQSLEDGKSEAAMQAWDKIQGNISNTSNRIREQLQKQANLYKAKLTELRDWKTFAATEKKKELITQMKHLVDSKMHASDRSKHISKMHQEWKSLGRSNQNESLWKKFKKLSDEAYAPCKEHFKQRKQLMQENLKQRRQICERLESELKTLKTRDDEAEDLTTTSNSLETEDDNNQEPGEAAHADSQQAPGEKPRNEAKHEPGKKPNISALNKLLSTVEQDWKRFAPIEQSKTKSLQKRFYASINEIRKIRKASLGTNAKQKQACVAKAKALIELDDNKKAMNEAKRLQQEWKTIGPTSYKEDNKYWLEFRAACDKIFEKRNQVSNELREDLKKAEQDLGSILKSMESLFGLDDDSFRKSRHEFQDLAQRFSNALDPRLRQQRGRLLDQFNALKRKIDSRFKTLPDKKQQRLRKIILEKAEFLNRIELELLDAKDDSKFLEIRDQLDHSAWDDIEPCGNNKFDSALKERLDNVLKAGSSDSIHKLAQKNESGLRSLCIETEIRANIETPAQDQAQRMQIQLQQLKNGFGQSKPDSRENAKHAMEIELKSHCFGPLENDCRQELTQRLQLALKKLQQ